MHVKTLVCLYVSLARWESGHDADVGLLGRESSGVCCAADLLQPVCFAVKWGR